LGQIGFLSKQQVASASQHLEVSLLICVARLAKLLVIDVELIIDYHIVPGIFHEFMFFIKGDCP